MANPKSASLAYLMCPIYPPQDVNGIWAILCPGHFIYNPSHPRGFLKYQGPKCLFLELFSPNQLITLMNYIHLYPHFLNEDGNNDRRSSWIYL